MTLEARGAGLRRGPLLRPVLARCLVLAGLRAVLAGRLVLAGLRAVLAGRLVLAGLRAVFAGRLVLAGLEPRLGPILARGLVRPRLRSVLARRGSGLGATLEPQRLPGRLRRGAPGRSPVLGRSSLLRARGDLAELLIAPARNGSIDYPLGGRFGPEPPALGRLLVLEALRRGRGPRF